MTDRNLLYPPLVSISSKGFRFAGYLLIRGILTNVLTPSSGYPLFYSWGIKIWDLPKHNKVCPVIFLRVKFLYNASVALPDKG